MKVFPSTCNFSIGFDVLIPTFPPSLIINDILSSSKNWATSVFPYCITSNAGPVPSFDIANLSVKIIFVSIVLTCPNIRKSPFISILLHIIVSSTYIFLFTDKLLIISTWLFLIINSSLIFILFTLWILLASI